MPVPHSSVSSPASFPINYGEATQRFLTLAADLGHLRTHTLAEHGPDGEALASHSLWLGPDDASRVLVLMSGTHGVEGLAGSAVQQDLLQQILDGALTLPPDCACLMVHLLNPWGTAWLRRCDQQGIDLNRNFVDFRHPLPENPGYDALRDGLLGASPTTRQQQLHAFEQQHGRTALEIAISGGQYTDPAGPFYGGQAPAAANHLIHGLIREHRLASRQLAVIDLHTGLGPYGYGEIICDHAPDSPGTATARRWYGDAVTLPATGTSSSVPKAGLLDYAWHAIMDARSCFVTLEFGSFATDTLFEVIIADHRLHRHGMPDWHDAATRQVKQAMRHHFCPDAQQWRELVLFRARQVIGLALTGLSS
ncbi:MAG: M14 family metallopeptidase [Alcanivorax sp.]|nr:M14 family metallopeptidase [Alcanivorax sp.]